MMVSVYLLENTCTVPCQRTCADGAGFEPRSVGGFRPLPAMGLTKGTHNF